ncbi:hypothetical protein BRY73_06285 [Ochrobactrum sp. P6BS-III]|uniref:FkbM family methyltransferase n=1 Tax=unclassified Ochrobactrum TaxID=239106 RepID=UPI0009D0FB4C|nr:FkbM family methyltransferase [Ochrobactrum sp. P6BSIII]OOL18571.1 hypothetical protein BRY73_06285 [Ochrobactrum sp. P6BS-III]
MQIDQSIINRSGKRIYFDPTDKRGEQLAGSDGTLAPYSLALWNVALKLCPWDYVVDVGCNYGEMLVSADLPVKAEIVAFEPNPRILPYLRKTLSESGTPVRLIERAVAEAVKESTIFVVDEDWSGTSGLPKETDETVFGHNHRHSDISVAVTTLDHEFLDIQPTNICIKIDVEGHEFSVLAGAKKLFEQAANWAVVLEILHMRPTEISKLAKDYSLYVLEKHSEKIVKLDGANPSRLEHQISDLSLYLQDALLVSSDTIINDTVLFQMPADNGGLQTHKLGHPNSTETAPRRVVYTALIGAYELLNEQPVAESSKIDFICFTDDPALVSESWEIRLIEPRFPRDTIRSARYLKVMGPDILGEYDESLWIDNSIVLRATPESILDEWLADADFTLPLHGYRESVAGEFDAVDAAGYDDPSRIYEQMITYAAVRPAVLEEKPYATNFMARRHTAHLREAMRLWYEQILRYSRRDQLSLNYALSVTGLPAHGIDMDLFQTDKHQWPVSRERKTNVTRGQLSNVLRIPHVEMGRLENTAAALQNALTQETALRNETESKVLNLQAALAAAQGELNSLRSSSSWRVTQPLRWAGSHLAVHNRTIIKRGVRALWRTITLASVRNQGDRDH